MSIGPSDDPSNELAESEPSPSETGLSRVSSNADLLESKALGSADSTAAALGFALRLEAGKAILELRDRALGGGLHLERLEMEIPNVKFPFDVSGGAERFRSQRCDLRTIVLKISNETLAKWLHRPALGEAGFRELELVHDEGTLFCSGRLEHGVNDVRFAFRFAPIILTPRSLLLFFFDEKVFGTLDVAAPRIPHMMMGCLELLPKAGQVPTFDIVELAVRRLLPAYGWKIPNTTEVGLVTADAAKSGLIAACGVNLVTQHSTNLRVSLAFDQRAVFEEVEAALARGDEADAYQRVRKAIEAEIAPPFAVRRLLQLAAANERWFEEGRSVAEETLANDPKEIDAHHYLAQLAQREGDLGEAARRYAMAAEHAWANRDERVAAFYDVTAAELARHGMRDLAKSCLQRTLARRRHDSRALTIAFELAIEDKRNQEASDFGERLLRVLPEGERFDVHLGLGRLFLGRDLKKAKVHAERALRANMESERALRLVADVYAEQGDIARALRTYSRLAERAAQNNSTADSLSLELKIVSLIEAAGNEQPRALLTRLQRILVLDPRQREAMQRAARLAFELGEHVLAKRYYEELLNGGDEALVAEASFALGSIARKEGRPLEAELFFETAATGAGHQDAYRALLSMYEERSDLRSQYRLEDVLANRSRTPASSVEHHLRAANLALALSDMQSCIEHLNAGLEIGPDHRLIKQRLFEVLSDMTPSEAKVQLLSRWARTEHEPEMRSEWFVALAGVLEGIGREPQAKEALKEAVKANPGALEANEALYSLCQRLGDPYGAFEALGNIARHRAGTDDARAELRISQAELLAGPLAREDEARAYLLRALVDVPHHVRGLWLLAGLSEKAGDVETAFPAYERYLETGDTEHRMVALDKVATYALDNNDLAKAHELLRALWRESQRREVLDRLVTVLRQRGEFASVADILRDAAREADPVLREQLVWQTAEMLRDSVGDWAAARKELEQIADSPSELGQKARVALIELAQEEGRTDLIAPALIRALEFANTPEARLQLSLSLARARRELSEQALAAEAYEAVLELDPDDIESLSYVADYSEHLGDREEAFRYWLRIARLDAAVAWPKIKPLIDEVDSRELYSLVDPPWALPRDVAEALCERFVNEKQAERAITALEHCEADEEERFELELRIVQLEEFNSERPDLALKRVERLRQESTEPSDRLEAAFERLVEKTGTPLMRAELALRHANSADEALAAIHRVLSLQPTHDVAQQRLAALGHTTSAQATVAEWLDERLGDEAVTLAPKLWLSLLDTLHGANELSDALLERYARMLREYDRIPESNPVFARLWLQQPKNLSRLEEWLEGIDPALAIDELLDLVENEPLGRAQLVEFVTSEELQQSFGSDFAMSLMARLDEQNSLGDNLAPLPRSIRTMLAVWLKPNDRERANRLLSELVDEDPKAELLVEWLGDASAEDRADALASVVADERFLQATLALQDQHRALRVALLGFIDEALPLSDDNRLYLARDARALPDDELASRQFERLYRAPMRDGPLHRAPLDPNLLLEWLLSETDASATARRLFAETEDADQARKILADIQLASGVVDEATRLALRKSAADRALLDSNALIALAQDEAKNGDLESAHRRLTPLVEQRPNDAALVELWMQTAPADDDELPEQGQRRLQRRKYEWQRQQLQTSGTPHQLAELLATAVQEGVFAEPMASAVRKAFIDAGSFGRALEWAKKATTERPDDVSEWRERCRLAMMLDEPSEVLSACEELAEVDSMDGESLQDFRALRANELLEQGHPSEAETLFVEVLEADPTHNDSFAALRQLWKARPKDLLGFARRRALFHHDDAATVRTWYDLAQQANQVDEEEDAIAALSAMHPPLVDVAVAVRAVVLAGSNAEKLARAWKYAEPLLDDIDADTQLQWAQLFMSLGDQHSDIAAIADTLLTRRLELSDDHLQWLCKRRLHAQAGSDAALRLLLERRTDLPLAGLELQKLWLEAATVAGDEEQRVAAIAALGKDPNASFDVKIDLVRIYRQRKQDVQALELVDDLLGQPEGKLTSAQQQGLATARRELIYSRAKSALLNDPAAALRDAQQMVREYPESQEVQALALDAASAAEDDEALLDVLSQVPASDARTLQSADALDRLERFSEAATLRLRLLNSDNLDAAIDRHTVISALLSSLERAGDDAQRLALRERFDDELDEPAQVRWEQNLALAEELENLPLALQIAQRLFAAEPADPTNRARLLNKLDGSPLGPKHLEVWVTHLRALPDPITATHHLVRQWLSSNESNAVAAATTLLDSIVGEATDSETQQLRFDLAVAAGDHEQAYALLGGEVAGASAERRLFLLERLEALAHQLGRDDLAALHFADAFLDAPTADRWLRFAQHEAQITAQRDVKPLLDQALRVVPDDDKRALLEKLAELSESRERPSEALAYYRLAHERAPEDLTLGAHVARLHEQTGDVHGLVDHLARQHSASLDRRERYAIAMRIAELCDLQLQDGDQAELFYRQAAKDDPEERAPHDALLKLYQTRSATLPMMATLEALITMTQDGQERARFAQQLGDLRLEAQDATGAAAAYLYVLNEGVSSAGLRQIIVAQAQAGNHVEAALTALVHIGEHGDLDERAAAFEDAAHVAASLQDYMKACALIQRSFDLTTPSREALQEAASWADSAGLGEVSLRLLDRIVDVTDSKAELIALHRQRTDVARTLGRSEIVLDAELELFRMSALDTTESIGLARALAKNEQKDESRFVVKALARQELDATQKANLRSVLESLGELDMIVHMLAQTQGDPLERGAALCEAARLCIEQLGDQNRGYQLYCEALSEGVALSDDDLAAIMTLAESRGDDETLSAVYLRVAESEAPRDKRAQAYAAMAKFWQQRGDTARSEDCLRAALKLTPDDVAMKRRLADLLLADNRLEDAAPLLTTLEPPEDATPERRAAWLKVAAEAALRSNDEQKALELLERAGLEDNDGLFRAYDMRERRGEKQHALVLMLDRLDRPEPQTVEVLRWQKAARLAVELRDGEGELRVLQQLAAQNGLDGLGMARIAALFELRGDNAAAIQWISKRASTLNGVEKAGALLQATKLAFETNDTEQARTLLNQAFDEAPSHTSTLEALYDGYSKIGDKERALVVGERLVLLAPNHPFRDDFHVRLAESAAQVGDTRRALDLYALAQERRPLSAEQFDRALRLAEAAGGELAGEWREKAIIARGGTADDFARLAKEARERGDLKRAEKLLDKARAMAPGDEALLRAYVESMLSDRTAIPEAIRLYRDFIETNPLDAEAWRTLARLYGQQNDVDRTFIAYDSLLALLPDDAEATQFVSAARTLLPELPVRALAPAELAELAERDLLSPLQSFYSPLSAQAELLYPSDLARLGLTEQNRLTKDQSFGRRMSMIQQVMGGRATEAVAYQSSVASLDAVVEPGAPPKLVLGTLVTTANNRVAQFIVARSLAVLSFGHLLPSRLPRADVAMLMTLLVRRFVSSVKVEGLSEDRVEGFLARFRIVTPDDAWSAHAATADVVAQQMLTPGTLPAELDKWVAAGDVAADRWALLIAGEMQAAFAAPKLVGTTLQAPPPATGPTRLAALQARPDLIQLLRFAVSDRYANLRTAIGWVVRR